MSSLGGIQELLQKITSLVKDNQELRVENAKLRNAQMGNDTGPDHLLNERNQLKKDNAEYKIALMEMQHKLNACESKLAQAKSTNLKLEQAAKNLITENLKLKEQIHGSSSDEV